MKKVYWFEVYQDFGDDGTETIANFDTEIEAETFIENHADKDKLGYDEWMMNENGSGIEKIDKNNLVV